jgi:hypothetical protein
MSLIKVFENDNFIVDYDKDKRRYRVSVFEDHHFQDEFWFDAYEENPYIIEIKRKLSPSEIESIFGSTNIGALDCSDMSDEEIDRIVDEFNSIGCTSFQLTSEEIKEILEGQEYA